MILIDKEDSIVDILKKISSEKDGNIVLSFPFWHPVLHNRVSLKTIKGRTKNKKLLILTNDKASKKIGAGLWIHYKKNNNYNHNEGKIKKTHSTQYDILKENYSFLEYALFEYKKIIWYFQWKKKIKLWILNEKKYGLFHKNILPFSLIILIIIILLLLYIFYFAINKTLITISPEINIKRKSRNYTYVEHSEGSNDKKNNEITLIKIEKDVSYKQTFSTTGFTQLTNNKSKWKADFYNYLKQDIDLLSGSTLKTQEGIIFTTNAPIFLPAGTLNTEWKIIPSISSHIIYNKIQRINWLYSWDKANISSGTTLILPKLWELQSKIFAKSTHDFIWWSNKIIPTLLQSDLDTSVEILTSKLQEQAINAVKNEIIERNKKNSIKMAILPVDGMYKLSNINIVIPDYLEVWTQQKEFEITGTIHITSYMYNTESVISQLQWIITDTMIPEIEQLVLINSESLRIPHVIKRNDFAPTSSPHRYLNIMKKPLRIKATTQLSYQSSKNFKSIYNNNNVIEKLKQWILGKNIKDAHDYLLNQIEIDKVSISVRPFFLNNISKFSKNIDIIIEK